MFSKLNVVIAHKYNDILYSVETEEFKEGDYNILLIFKLHGYNVEDYPFLDKFNQIFTFDYDKINIKKNVLRFIIYLIKNRKFLRSNYVFISNPNLLYNKIFAKIIKPKGVILIEDGTLNYVSNKVDIPCLKRIFQYLCGIDNDILLDITKSTYLSLPDEATLYSGEKKKIVLPQELSLDLEDNIELLKGKKIFIGQNLYPKYCSENEYYNLVKRILKEYNIEYYIPHAYEYYDNQLDFVMTSKIRKYTLEYIAQFTSFELYSLSSSVLLTTKFINKDVSSTLFKVDFCAPMYSEKLFSICDHIIDLNY
ncbi:glycosyltransferase family 52 [Lonepinella sp. BR2919]|uniref:glycosyltransferase family 52 n=1 Tax=unclassified Lonepinella TaxID=2642006 RepID=UPI003F6E249D